jgi:hypothetical protein
MGRFHRRLVYFLLSATNTLARTNTLAYYGIRKLRIRSVFIVQAPGNNPDPTSFFPSLKAIKQFHNDTRYITLFRNQW